MNQPDRKPRAPKQPATNKPTATPGGTTYYHYNQAVFIPDGHLAIGRITTAHSLRGEVRVELHTDFPERFSAGTTVLVGSDLAKYKIEEARPHKTYLLVKFAGIENRNQAEALRGEWIFVTEANAVPLEADTYWVHQIIGMQVVTENGEILGTVSDVLFTGANEVYIVERAGDETNAQELLLPAIADVVQAVDLAQKRITVRLLPGLE